jgi:hypothetical protein
MKTRPRYFLLSLCAMILVLSLLPVWQASASPLRDVSVNFRSVGANDGWVRESTELSNVGGAMNAVATTFNLGDDASNRQYRAILQFNTASIPDTATISAVKLTIHRQGAVVGTNPFTTHGLLRLDIRKGFFGPAATLAASDFQAPATKNNAGAFSSTAISGGSEYQAILPASSFQYINLAGITQFRLRFSLDDNNDLSADYMRFFSGNYTVVSDRPELEVEFTP